MCSMISEQVKELREFASYSKSNGKQQSRAMREAADTIEALSAKLAAANMERSTAYYNGGWIPCAERLPEAGEDVLIDIGVYGIEIAYYTGENMWFHYGECSSCIPLAWMPLPEPWKGVERT